MKQIISLFGLILLSHNVFSQSDSTKVYSIGFNHGKGFIISHSPTMARLANRHISITELNVQLNTYGNKKWHIRYNYLKIGVMLKHFQLNNKTVLGNALTVSPYLKFSIFSKHNFSLGFKSSIGLGYLGKKFKDDSNYENIAIGSHINMFLSALIEANLKLYKNIHWNFGIGLDHLSNTGFKTPNLGINMPYLNSGISLDFGETKEKKKLDEAPLTRNKAYWLISSGIGFNEINPPNGQKYLVKALAFTREKKMNRKSSIGTGVDLFYNPAQKAILSNDSNSISNIENTQIALSIIHILHFKKLSFTSQLSYYIKSKNEKLGKVYHTFGGRYYINERFNAFFSGKTHIDKAEFIILGFGYKFRNE
jgi:hypothetical protein